MKLFDYQEENLEATLDFFNHGGRSMVSVLATGTGKSVIAKAFMQRIRAENQIVYFLTHSKQLLRQFSEHLTEIGVRHGIIAPGYPVLRYKVQVISVQSLANRYMMLDEPAFMVFEECHHAPANIFKKPLEYWPKARLLGYTATPGRPDGTPLDMFEHMEFRRQVRWYIDQGYLTDFDYYAPAELDTSMLHHTAGDFNKKELAEVNKWRIKSFVQAYQKHSPGKSGIAFGVDIADSERIAKEFTESGYEMTALHSKIKDVDAIFQEIRNKPGVLISSADLIGEGTDIKGLSVEIDARPTESIVIKMQHSGRVLRAQYAPGHDLYTREGRMAALAESGKRAKILDFCSNFVRHGLPDDDREWSLTPKRKIEKGVSELKKCPQCERPVLRVLMECPHCRYVWGKAPPSPRVVNEKDGELVKLGGGQLDLPMVDDQILIRRIAREARNGLQAQRVARMMGLPDQRGLDVWVKVLKNRA
jgi:DNA repair protein RadD